MFSAGVWLSGLMGLFGLYGGGGVAAVPGGVSLADAVGFLKTDGDEFDVMLGRNMSVP
jgi:hypothetical protein